MIPRKYIQKLRSELVGRLLESGDPGYDHSLDIDNGRIDLRPGVVAMCANAEDVITAYKVRRRARDVFQESVALRQFSDQREHRHVHRDHD